MGRLYGRCGGQYFPLDHTSDDVDATDTYCTHEYLLDEKSDTYSIMEIMNNAIRKIPGKEKISIVSSRCIKSLDDGTLEEFQNG